MIYFSPQYLSARLLQPQKPKHHDRLVWGLSHSKIDREKWMFTKRTAAEYQNRYACIRIEGAIKELWGFEVFFFVDNAWKMYEQNF